jgi:hypothetical protein
VQKAGRVDHKPDYRQILSAITLQHRAKLASSVRSIGTTLLAAEAVNCIEPTCIPKGRKKGRANTARCAEDNGDAACCYRFHSPCSHLLTSACAWEV